jgi:hypothetical protein
VFFEGMATRAVLASDGHQCNLSPMSALPFTFKSILWQKKNYENSNTYFTMQKYNFQKNPLKETKTMKP